MDDLECDYYGTSLHKWLTAPVGTGFLYVRRDKIATVWPHWGAPAELDGDIRKFESIGTHSVAPLNAITEALTFQESIGPPRKAAQLRYLRERWVAASRGAAGRPGAHAFRSRAGAFEGVQPFIESTKASLNEDRKLWTSLFNGQKEFDELMSSIEKAAEKRLMKDGKLVMTKVVGGILATK